MKTTLLSILTIAGILVSAPAFGEKGKEHLAIKFRQGRSDIDSTLPGNKSALSTLDSLSSGRITLFNKVNIIGGASPEGAVSLNDRLSDRRAERILDIIRKGHNIPDSIITIDYVGRDWEGLLQLVKGDANVPYREETLSFLEETVARIKDEGHEKGTDRFLEKLKEIGGGTTYRYLYSNLFPTLRASQIEIGFNIIHPFEYNPSIPYLTASIKDPSLDYTYEPKMMDKESNHQNFYMALKSNLLYDALALPSLSAEFYLGKNLSIVGNWTYGWWDKDSAHRYWRAYGGDLAARWWFGKKAHEKPLTGHHLGVYGGILTYDFEFGGKGFMGGLPHETLWNRSLRMAGIEYGYSLPIAKRLNIDFTIGIGYLGGKYIKYIPDNGRYLWQSTHKINWFGPTKAEISLTWLIGRGNWNGVGKGGNL